MPISRRDLILRSPLLAGTLAAALRTSLQAAPTKLGMPGPYPGRTRHYHVRIQAPGESRVLTTQFYFPDERRNRTDELFRRELVMQIARGNDTLLARFDVVL